MARFEDYRTFKTAVEEDSCSLRSAKSASRPTDKSW